MKVNLTVSLGNSRMTPAKLKQYRNELWKRGLCIYNCGNKHRPKKRTCKSCVVYLNKRKRI